MKSNTTSFLQLLLVLVTPSLAYKFYRLKIPNGENVPHPCKANYTWDGVGHKAPIGGGDRNVFGLDFKAAGLKWTDVLCRKDSDDDGKTNGEELGDPDCQWNEGEVPKIVTGITHPGVCNPYGQGRCKGKDTYVDCSDQTLDNSCDIIKKKPEVKTVDLKFKKHNIPNTETNYFCQNFDLPQDEDYHVVAQEGVIDNQHVSHHMLLFGCLETYERKASERPYICSMGGDQDHCPFLIGEWTVGLKPRCFDESVGFKIGKNGFKKVILEIHYNNPMLRDNYTDETAFRLYYRPWNSSVQELATFMIGQTDLEIPPGKKSVVAKGCCESSETKKMTKPMHVISAINHMHYLGRSQKTEVIRNGTVVKVLANDESYSYDSPVVHRSNPPFQVLPGDELATTCTYSSLSRNETVGYGEGTSGEMCFAFLSIYPADAVANEPRCLSHGPPDKCVIKEPELCDWKYFTNLSQPQMMKHDMDLKRNCDLACCRVQCKPIAENLLKHPCLQEEMQPRITRIMEDRPDWVKFLKRLRSCSGSKDMKDKIDCQQGPGSVGSYLVSPHLIIELTTTLVVMANCLF